MKPLVARCDVCGINPVAWVKPRVDYCYPCLPGGPFTAPACSTCGSNNYFSDGLCEICHPHAPLHPDSCLGCLAWGVHRVHGSRCWACRWWQNHYPTGQCLFCRRETNIGEMGACRMCLDQARMLQQPGRALDLPAANRHGQQLSFANLRYDRPGGRRRNNRPPSRPVGQPRRHQPGPGGFRPLTWRQLWLFNVVRDPALVRARALSTDSDLIRHCSTHLREHADRHGWSERQTNAVIGSLRILQVLQDTPGAKINASDVEQISRYGGTIESTLEVLAAASLLIDDRIPPIQRYFAGKTAQLPEPMKNELGVWLEVMLNGSSRTPRRRGREPQTVRLHILGVAPILAAWADAGHQSLAEITPEQVRAALPATGSRRNFAESGLRSLFSVLKARKQIFTNPTRGMPITPIRKTVPLPLDTAAIRAALDSPDPAVALAVALVAFHALTASQIQHLKLTDIVDARLSLTDRDIPLAAPVLVRLRAWLDHRAATWPATINPHLFIGRRSAPRLGAVGPQFPFRKTDLRPQALREDRILQQIQANGGDIRQICDLFDLTVEAATRYAKTQAHPDLEHPPVPVQRTRHIK